MLILTHSPLQRVPADTVNLHGHIHAAPAPTRHHRNLSVERTGYQPIRLSELLTTDLRRRARDRWKMSRMVAHYSAGATAERGAVALYL